MKICLAIERKHTKFMLSQWLRTATNSYCHSVMRFALLNKFVTVLY